MNKKSPVFCLVYVLVFLMMYTSGHSQNENRQTPLKKNVNDASKKVVDSTLSFNFDSLLVIHFHPTVQCSCCINAGSFAKEGLIKFYTKPYEDGHIIFKEYNIDKDSLIAKRYKIFWSALGFQKFSGKDNTFKEIESVWQFCEEKDKFLSNFQEQLETFIADKENKKVKNTAK
ncbi:MAG TPA: nitrophenyl compound nitroreductase subunit ArsF family protein [candidate division Zixibacteria bacterium]